ncbi:uncharacterized protein LOC111988086 [Quercus suber]|nr:uncharacterized protein LOC111988086 [Quercus suber]POF23433.1 hypothetical protein CFP56_07345 [Quercus suber]
MLAVKVGCVGQTFALAKGNESDGRKSRIRRSKEERKAMVESFIKKYQKTNNGSFPSLNLTHKEVGGSFYTVREIVRDIIQENRVLGPAMLSLEEQSSYQFLEQDPLFSMATEPQIPPSLISNESHLLSNRHQGTREELVIGSDGHDTGPDHQMFERIVNGTQVDVKDKKSDESTCIKLQVDEPSEAEKHLEEEWAAPMAKISPTIENEEQVSFSDGHFTEPENQMLDNRQTIDGSQLDFKNKNSIELTCTNYQLGEPSEADRNTEELAASKAKVNPIVADVIVETFPLQRVTKTTDSLGGSLGESKILNNPAGQKENGKLELEPGNGLLFERNSGSVEKEVVDLSEPSLESSNYLIPGEDTKHDTQSIEVLEAKVSSNDFGIPQLSENSQDLTGAKAVNALTPNDNIKILKGTCTGSSSVDENTPETIINQPKADLHGGNSQRGSNPTLDRINLESWEGTTKAAKPETNPLLATIKAFIAAFVKFWSE